MHILIQKTQAAVKVTSTLSFFARSRGIVFLVGYIWFVLPAFSQVSYKPVYTVENVSVNHTIPKNSLKPGEPVTVVFSKEPKDEEIFRAHFFEEPLVPMEGGASSKENSALVLALAAFNQRISPDDFTAITDFMKEYPDSRWKGALLANLGIVYRRTGYYQEAMDSWQQAWKLMKEQQGPRIKILADKVVAELLLINCWVGRMEKIESLLKEVDNRIITGPAAERVLVAREGFLAMKNDPGVSFKCGPYALNQILLSRDSSKVFNEKLREVRSTPRGFTLNEVRQMSKDIGLNYQMAFRQPGAPVILNSVVHWKLNHYSALLINENRHYGCQDATMGIVDGQRFWLTHAALDSSASGYFLVPEGPLPSGWRRVSAGEANNVFGRGNQKPPTKFLSGDDKKCPDCPPIPGMAQSNVHACAVSLHIADRPVFYMPPKGPAMMWDVHYLQRDNYQPSNFNYTNLGQQWTFQWLSYVQDDPGNPSADADVYLPGGGIRTFTGFNAQTQSYAPELQTKDVLVRIDISCYELRHPDGSKDVYSNPDGSTINGRRVFLTRNTDVAGNSITIFYDPFLRITSLQDALGQVTTISYENPSDIYKVVKVTDPFGRFATFQYDGSGRLISITDVVGMVSSFQYDAGDFITQMTTPYGVTKFTKTEGEGTDYSRSIETTYPLGAKEKVEYRENAPEIPMSDPVAPSGMRGGITNTYLVYRNTFFWDKKAMQDAPGDYTKARIYHWLHGSGTDGPGYASPILESIKEPLENRVWFTYQDQSSSITANPGMSSKPSDVGRVLDDGTSQITKFNFNLLDADTVSIDPFGRKLSYRYDSTNINLTEIRQTTLGSNELLAKFTYNTQHLPLTATDASGKTTTYTYNPAGQVTTIKNPKNETTTFTYDAKGYLRRITGPVAGATTSFTYDPVGRMRTVTDAEGYKIIIDYDPLDRPTIVTYPDGTFEQIAYDRLDAVATKDRMNRWTHALYDSLRRLNAITDPLGRITQFIWCNCGSLAEIVDPLKQTTLFERDLQGRLTSKIYHDGTKITYKYDSTSSRLAQVTDAKGQVTNYTYFIDDNLKQITYGNAVVPTPTVAFTYDGKYNRITGMLDGTGITSYTYYPITANPVLGAGRLQKVDGPLTSDDIVYSYDVLSRDSARSINGVAYSVTYDSLGRIKSAANSLGNFAYSYVNTTNRLLKITNPNNTSTDFIYFDNLGDQRLKEIWNKNSTITISRFGYEYNKEGQITKWTQTGGNFPVFTFDFSYDLADQLTSATRRRNQTILNRFAYTYDKAGNRLSEQVANKITSFVYDSVNRLTAQTSGGPMRFKGTVNEFASVLLKNNTSLDSAYAPVDSLTNSFEGFVKMAPGVTNNISIKAIDYSGNNNTSTNSYNVAVGVGVSKTLVYDANGNTISKTNPAVTYDWDAADRLVKITDGGNITEFVYDGLGRRVKEKLNNTVIRQWIWLGTELCEERDASNAVTRRFFPQGEMIGTTKYFFTRDHLGSLRELTNNAGNLVTRYDYDPYGRRTRLSGNVDADFGFTGHYFHAANGLYLTRFRVYDAGIGRWLSRDPIGENGGTNLYNYVLSNPSNLIDILGLDYGNVNSVSSATINVSPPLKFQFPENPPTPPQFVPKDNPCPDNPLANFASDLSIRGLNLLGASVLLLGIGSQAIVSAATDALTATSDLVTASTDFIPDDPSTVDQAIKTIETIPRIGPVLAPIATGISNASDISKVFNGALHSASTSNSNALQNSINLYNNMVNRAFY